MLSFDIDEVRRIAHEEAAKICPPLDEESFKRLARELEANDRELVEEVSSITGIDRRHLMGPLRLVSRAERIEELLDEEARFEQEITSPEWVERFNDPYVRARRNKAIGKIVALNSTNELGRYTGTTSVVHPDTEILYVDNLAAYSKPDRKAVQGHEKTHRGQFKDVSWLQSYMKQMDGSSQKSHDLEAIYEGECDNVAEKISPGSTLRVRPRDIRKLLRGPKWKSRDHWYKRHRGLSTWQKIEQHVGDFPRAREVVWQSPESIPTGPELTRIRPWLRRAGLLPTARSRRRQ